MKITTIDTPTQLVIDYFMKLAEIPRKSGHEEAVSKYLYDWAIQKGFVAVRDEVNNVIIDKPATKGYDDKPLTILQGHIDMVCIAKEGYSYNPLTDPIKVINNGVTLTADGTSLGADDGIGVAIAQYILTHGEHGPLRVIFTVNEEELMLGAEKIDSSYLKAKYLINLDSETDNVLTNSSAGGMTINLTKTQNVTSPDNNQAIELCISGLVGGHSGVEINKGILNAIRAICYTLLSIGQHGINYELCSINGGKADNAIPNKCTAIIVIKSNDIDKFKTVFTKIKELIFDTYSYVEKNMKFEYTKTSMPEKVLCETDAKNIITFATQIINGVHTMSPVVDGLVQSSSNIGVMAVNPSTVQMTVYWRSSDELFIEQIYSKNIALAEMCNLQVKIKTRAPGWPVNPLSTLAPLVKDIYKEQNGEDMIVNAIHAGLECSWFCSKNADVDIISVGPNLTEVHSPAETLQIASIPKTLNLVLETLKRI